MRNYVKYPRSLLLGFVFLLAVPSNEPVKAMTPQEESGKAYREAYKLILEEKWGDAIKSLESLVQKFPESAWADDAHFWLCYARERTDASPERSFECYERFVHGKPKSEWANDAKMNMVRIGRQLAKSGKPQYEEKIKALRDVSDSEIESAVLIALLDMGDDASLATVIARLDHISNEEVRSKVVRMLGEHSTSPKLLGKLSELARKDPSPRVRRSAVHALGDTKNPEVIAVLKEIALSNDRPAIRKAALEELRDVETQKTEVIALLKKIALTDPSLAESAVDSLKDLRGAEGLQALQSLYSEAKTSELRREVVHALGDREEDRGAILQFLVTVVSNDSDTAVRRAAVSSIGDTNLPEALEALKKIASTSTDFETREAVLRAVGEFEGEGTVEILAAFIKAEKDARLRRAAAAALGKTEKDAAVSILAELARTDPNADVRRTAIRSLGEIRTPAARDALIKLLDQKKDE
jgi:HEAT repeat protein